MPHENLKFDPSSGQRRILIIEDEPINREILEMMLQGSYDCVCAENGKQALEIIAARHKSLSLVLLDLNLPDMKGIDILRHIKNDVTTAMLPVIVTTADQEAEVECLNLGATDYISKPYPKQEVVLARILRTIELYEDRDILSWTERDHLTGLYNRDFFYHYADQFDTYYKGRQTDAIILDINHFHILNERYGKEFCDEILKKMARAIHAMIHAADGLVCRRSADMFLVYCLHREDYEDILESASVVMDGGYQVRVRMGVYSNVDREIDMERRFDRAKQAADLVKNNFANSIGIYDDAMHDKELFNEQLLEDFHTAIAEKQFEVYYQPKFGIQQDKPVLHSAEALVRWIHPRLGFISPGAFIPLFEENGLIRELDTYVWREAAAKIREWKKTLGRTIPVSINVSRIDLSDASIASALTAIVREAGIDNGEFHLEITESAYTSDSQKTVSIVSELRRMGFLIEMDDFGTGYSSLNMLTALPIDALKIDMLFIRTAFGEQKDTRLLSAVFGIARSLGLPTIAEGVETEEQLNVLKTMGCDIVQGYYFSKPLPADSFEAFVRGLDS